ncbi:MAG: HD domain-containing protein, partial [Armatimonadota bacterium]|nr:HD domain-containing protein [Armatimonadota bacterium]
MNKAIRLRSDLVDEFDGTGLSWCLRNTEIADAVLQDVFSSTCPNAAIAVAAVGGYGRCELGPYGDLDMVFLSLNEETSQGEDDVRALFKALLAISDEIGWDIDYALRYTSDVQGLDDKSRTALLDARLVAGQEGVFARFMAEFNDTFPVARFLSDKRRERLDFRKKFGYTPRKVEFNLRDGAGGLRDYQAATWFRKVLAAERISGLEDSYDFMIAVRNALQITTGRKEDRLLRTRHAHVASRLGSEPQRVFAKLMRSAELFQEEWRKALMLAQMGELALAAGVVAKDGACVIEPGATLSAAAAGVCRAVDLGIRVEPGQIPNDVVGDGPAAADKLTTGAHYLRALDRSGVLSALIPAFHDTKYLLPDDPVHEFTVGEHTLCVVENLDELRSTGDHGAAWSDADHRALYLAAILHDLGKADSSAPHSVVGEDLSRQAESRLGLQPNEGDEIAWLVREHLTLARMARTHDLQSPGTPLELARICGTQQRLAMLYLLTIADIGAVSSETLTPHGLHSICDLYEKARSVIGVDEVQTDPAVYRSAALEKLRKLDEGEGVQDFLETMP